MKAFTAFAIIKYIIAHAFYGEYNFKDGEVYLCCKNGSRIEINSTNQIESQLVQIFIPEQLVEQYLESELYKTFPVLGYNSAKGGDLSAYLKIDLDNVQFIEMFDKWAN
ncbi:hypothetical protein [Methyloprofundus sp.]|uniref:hypothetical protein n=1 Tax=Methyloprofundus sp. TaxID=2020875 RepID=UPI003D0A142E